MVENFSELMIDSNAQTSEALQILGNLKNNNFALRYATVKQQNTKTTGTAIRMAKKRCFISSNRNQKTVGYVQSAKRK